MSPLRREAVIWLGVATFIALCIAFYVLWTAPDLNDLALHYAVL